MNCIICKKDTKGVSFTRTHGEICFECAWFERFPQYRYIHTKLGRLFYLL